MIFWCCDQYFFCATWYDSCDTKNQDLFCATWYDNCGARKIQTLKEIIIRICCAAWYDICDAEEKPEF